MKTYKNKKDELTQKKMVGDLNPFLPVTDGTLQSYYNLFLF